MTLYARSDVMGVAVSLDSGGCGQPHSRPVVDGAPKKLFRLDCPACESALAGDACWSGSRHEIPLTPDEEREAADLDKQAERMLQAEKVGAAKELARAIAAKSSAAPDDEDDEPDLAKVHVKTLQKMCREAGLLDKGSKAELVERLRSA